MLAGQRDDRAQVERHAAADTEATRSEHVHAGALERVGHLRAVRAVRRCEHFAVTRSIRPRKLQHVYATHWHWLLAF